jgi:hypothetical protein
MLADWEFFYDKIVLPTLHTSFQALSLFDQKIRQGLVDLKEQKKQKKQKEKETLKKKTEGKKKKKQIKQN